MKEELHLVLRLYEEKEEFLSQLTDLEAGLELMHLFVVDLLGRNTPAANVFSSIASHE